MMLKNMFKILVCAGLTAQLGGCVVVDHDHHHDHPVPVHEVVYVHP